MKKRAASKKTSSVKSRKTSVRKKATPVVHKSYRSIHEDVKIGNVLVENFVSLQKVMVDLSVKFDSLTRQISKLLELFETSAKSLAEKEFDLEKGGSNKKVVDKIDSLLDQNKVIARGLTLMHDKFPGREIERPPAQGAPMNPPQATTPQPIQKPLMKQGEYQKSISSNTQNGVQPEQATPR